MVDISSSLVTAGRNTDDQDVPAHRHAQEALAQHKKEGMDLAIRARIGALSVTALLLIYLNPNWDVVWYLFLAVLPCAGWPCATPCGAGGSLAGRIGDDVSGPVVDDGGPFGAQPPAGPADADRVDLSV